LGGRGPRSPLREAAIAIFQAFRITADA